MKRQKLFPLLSFLSPQTTLYSCYEEYKLFGTSSLVSMPPNGPPPNQGPGTTGPPNSTCPLPNNPGRVKTPTTMAASAAAASDELAQQGAAAGGGSGGGGGESVVGSFDEGSFG